MKKSKKSYLTSILAVFLAALLFAVALPAAAEEGDSGYQDVGPSGDGEPGDVEPDPPPVVEDPTPPPPEDPVTPPPEEPTPPPVDEPTPPPEEPTPTPDWGEEPTPGPEDPTPDPGTEEPTPEPTEEPPQEPTQAPPPPAGGTTGGGNNTSSSGTTHRTPIGSGSDIAQPSFSPRSTAPPITSSSSASEEDPANREPRYITFARVTQKTNSMSRVLYYSGAGSIGVGVLGLLILLVFIIRNRRIDARNERIFEEIAQAETRQPAPPRGREPEDGYTGSGYLPVEQVPAGEGALYQSGSYDQPHAQSYDQPYPQDYAQGYDAPPPAVHRPEPEALTVPVNGSVYTEEFDIPRPAAPYQAPPPREERAPARPSGAPALTSMYTEEFLLPEDMAQPDIPAPAAPPRPAPPPQRQPPAPQPPARDSSYDTTELLREILHGDEDR